MTYLKVFFNKLYYQKSVYMTSSYNFVLQYHLVYFFIRRYKEIFGRIIFRRKYFGRVFYDLSVENFGQTRDFRFIFYQKSNTNDA